MANSDLSFQQGCLVQQGYGHYTSSELRQLEWGLRFTPAACSLLTVAGLVFQAPFVLVAVAALGFWAFFAPSRHPMDLIYNHSVRHLFGATKLPPNPLQRRLACLAAGVMNVAAALLFLVGVPLAAFAIGGLLLVLQAIVISTHFCALSWMYEGVMRLLGRWDLPVPVDEAKRLRAGGAQLIDVRGPQEFARGHLEGAINIPLENLAAHAQALEGASALLYCRTGMRSQVGTKTLQKLGCRQVHNLGSQERGAATFAAFS